MKVIKDTYYKGRLTTRDEPIKLVTQSPMVLLELEQRYKDVGFKVKQVPCGNLWPHLEVSYGDWKEVYKLQEGVGE